MHQHFELQHGILRQDVENDKGMFFTRILILMITNVVKLKGFQLRAPQYVIKSESSKIFLKVPVFYWSSQPTMS